jgi:hypothetical protein
MMIDCKNGLELIYNYFRNALILMLGRKMSVNVNIVHA